jgi:transposase-like protein
VAEQRFNAVMEVLRDGLTVIEVADRYGVSRQTVHGWLRWASSGWRPPRSCPGLRHQPRPTRPGHDPEGLRTS